MHIESVLMGLVQTSCSSWFFLFVFPLRAVSALQHLANGTSGTDHNSHMLSTTTMRFRFATWGWLLPRLLVLFVYLFLFGEGGGRHSNESSWSRKRCGRLFCGSLDLGGFLLLLLVVAVNSCGDTNNTEDSNGTKPKPMPTLAPVGRPPAFC